MLTVKNPATQDWKSMSLGELARGNSVDTHFTRRIWLEVKDKCTEKQGILFKYLINPLLRVAAEMEYNGILVCPEEHKNVNKKLSESIMDMEDNLYTNSKVGNTKNLASDDDLGSILYESFGLFPPDWTNGGKASTSKATLNILMEQIDDELERRARS